MQSNETHSLKCPQCGTLAASEEELDSHLADSHMRRTTRLRRMLEGDGMVVAPFCLNAFHAKIAETVGFDAVYMTGFGTAAERGYPDVGLLTQTEMVQNAQYMVRAVDVPVVCDADTGYGNPLNVWRTVREYGAVGVAAIHLEDQVFPKKCGFFEGKQVVPLEEHTQKIRAALDARQDKDMVIIARTDALAVNSWEDVVQRCRVYHNAGADLVFVDGIRTNEEIRTYAEELRDLPRMYNGSLVRPSEVAKLGFKLMITVPTLPIVYRAVREAFRTLKEEDRQPRDMWDDRPEILAMLGLQDIYEMEKVYATESS